MTREEIQLISTIMKQTNQPYYDETDTQMKKIGGNIELKQ